MVPEVTTGNAEHMVCLNCARKIVSPRHTSKYERLTIHLKYRAAFTKTVKLSFARIDGLIKDNLPMEAYKSREWWSNDGKNSQSKAWLKAGWEVQEVNLEEGFVILKKTSQAHTSGKTRDSSSVEDKKPFIPAPARITKRKVPSKTKAARLYARIKNAERQRNVETRGLGHRRAYEKRLFSSDKHPA
jgi:hypothetical protein